jgi:hypothetical protein
MSMSAFAEFLDPKKIIDGANMLGALQASAIWALVASGLSFYIWQERKHHNEYDAEWRKIREKEAEADGRMADAVAKLADSLREIRTIVDERLPKGGR